MLNCPWDVEELGKRLPAKVKRFIAENNINLYTIDGIRSEKKLAWADGSTRSCKQLSLKSQTLFLLIKPYNI